MAVLKHTLAPPNSQQDALRSAMRDIQISIGDYYDETARSADADSLATRVRASVAFVQVVNELLRNSAVNRDYRAMFSPPADTRGEIIGALEYARHLMQHVLYPAKPDPARVIGGLETGLRTYAFWEPVPASAHLRLRAPTQKLKPHYDKHLRGQEVTETLLDAAQFFSAVCPALVHRDANGEWTGFPLDHQPGMTNRLHPEEPNNRTEALAWMRHRRPGGDRRVICGDLPSDSDAQIVFGFTFVGRFAFVPFFETADQISRDIARGYPYHVGDVARHTASRLVTASRSVLYSELDVEQWAGQALNTPPTPQQHTAFQDLQWWRSLWAAESMPDPEGFLTRRERRLCTSMPSVR